MSRRDDELDALLKPLRAMAPNDQQLNSWQAAVAAAAQPPRITRARMAWQTVAAMLVGALVGAALMKGLGRDTSQLVAQNNSVASATFENSHANLD